jgi:hypothetical protein
MQYRFVKVANVILPVGPAPAEHPVHQRNRASRLLLAAAIGLAVTPLLLLGALFIWGRPAPIPTGLGRTAAATTISRLQIMQLENQIRQLEQETNVWAEFRSYVPLLSVMIVLGVGVFGAYRYFRDQDRDYALRVEQEISSNLNQLLDFTKEDGSQNARVASALDNLLWLITQAREPVRQVGRVTAAIVTAIKEDIDLDCSREARFPALCLEHWPDYAESFKNDEELQRLLPYRYNEALAKLAGKTPDYFAVVEFSKGKSFNAPEDVNDSIEETDYQFFVVLVDGLWQHLGYITNQDIREEAVADFQNSLHNPHLPGQLQERDKVSIEGRRS